MPTDPLVNFTILLAGAALPFGYIIFQEKSFSFLLTFPLFFGAMAWLILIQELYIDEIVVYINTRLAIKIELFLANHRKTVGGIWEWEVFQYSSFYKSKITRFLIAPLGLIKYSIPALAGVSALALYCWYLSNGNISPQFSDWCMIILDCIIYIILGVAIVILKLPRLSTIKDRLNHLSNKNI